MRSISQKNPDSANSLYQENRDKKQLRGMGIEICSLNPKFVRSGVLEAELKLCTCLLFSLRWGMPLFLLGNLASIIFDNQAITSSPSGKRGKGNYSVLIERSRGWGERLSSQSGRRAGGPQLPERARGVSAECGAARFLEAAVRSCPPLPLPPWRGRDSFSVRLFLLLAAQT